MTGFERPDAWGRMSADGRQPPLTCRCWAGLATAGGKSSSLCRRGSRCRAVAQVHPVFRGDRRTFVRSGLPAADLPSFQVRRSSLQTSLDELRDPDSTRFHDHETAVQAVRPLGKEFHDLVGERRARG